MAGLVDYAANSDSDEEIVEQSNEDAKLHLKDSTRSIDDMKSNMKLNIRPDVTSKVTIESRTTAILFSSFFSSFFFSCKNQSSLKSIYC